MAQGFTGVSKVDEALDRVEDIERGRTPCTTPLDDFGQPYQEVKSLVWARNDPVYSVALAEWERKERVFSARVERREKSSADLINQIFNLVGFFSGFQGLVLTAVTQLGSASSCKSQCRKVWFPILLTVVAAVVAIVGVLQKFQALKALQDSIKTEKQAQAEVIRRGERVRTEGPDFRFFDLKELPKLPPKSFFKDKGMLSVLLALVVFTVIFVVAHIAVLCDL